MPSREIVQKRSQVRAIEYSIAHGPKPQSEYEWAMRYRKLNLLKRLRRELVFLEGQPRLVCAAALAIALLAAGPARAAQWFYAIHPPNHATIYVGPFTDDGICADWCGSALYEHGPNCLAHPNPWNCRPIGHGFGVHRGATVDDCFAIPRKQAIAEQLGHRWGWYWFTYKDWRMHFAGWNGSPIPSWDLADCKRHSDECFAIGDIENTEGSAGGP